VRNVRDARTDDNVFRLFGFVFYLKNLGFECSATGINDSLAIVFGNRIIDGGSVMSLDVPVFWCQRRGKVVLVGAVLEIKYPDGI
jgi:hypothetical protein